MLTSECWRFAIVYPPVVVLLAQLRSEVLHLAKLVLSVSGLPSVPPRLLASELLQRLMSLGFCFVAGSVSRCGFVNSGFATTLEDVPLVHFSQLYTNSSSHSPRVPPPEAKSHERSQQCIANYVFRFTKWQIGIEREGSQQHLRGKKRHCRPPEPWTQLCQHRSCRVIEMMRRVGESVLKF